MRRKIRFLIITLVLSVFAVIFFCKIFLVSEPSVTYSFIEHFDEAVKYNFDIGELIDEALPKPEKEQLPENLNDIFINNKRSQQYLVRAGRKAASQSTPIKDGYIELTFNHTNRKDKECRVYLRYQDENNYIAVNLKTGLYAILDIYEKINGEEKHLENISLRLNENEGNGLEIIFINDFLSVGLNKITLYQKQGEISLNKTGTISITENNTTLDINNLAFMPLSKSLKDKLLYAISNGAPNMFRLGFFKQEKNNWNLLYPEYELATTEKPNKVLRRLKLENLTMPSIYFMIMSMAHYEVKIPENAVLEFSLAGTKKYMPNPSRIYFLVKIKSKSDSELSDTISFAFDELKDFDKKFIHKKLDLAKYAGELCEIKFELLPITGSFIGDENKIVVALGDPRISTPRSSDEKNIIIISLDTLAADHVSSYGYSRKTTPVLDKFGEEYTRFANVITAAPYTLPSHMSMFTSLYPNETGYINYVRTEDQLLVSRIAKNVKTLAQYLSKAGYKTSAITGGGMMNSDFEFDKGFGLYNDRFKIVQDAKIAFDDGLEWLEQNKDNKFFLFLHTYEIHQPYLRDYFAKDLDKDDTAQKELAIAKYDSCVRHADEQVGRLLEYLNKENLLENTLIIITSDHGENFREVSKRSEEETYGHHGETLYDCELKVPMFIGGVEDFARGKVVDCQVRTVDILPTILDYLNIPHDKNIRGSSMLHLLLGADEKERIAYSEAVLFETYPGYDPKSLRTKNYKYIKNVPLKDYKLKRDYIEPEFLYDLNKDAHEKTNLADIEIKIRSQFKSQLDRLLKSIKQFESKLVRRHSDNLEKRKDLEDQLRSLGYIN